MELKNKTDLNVEPFLKHFAAREQINYDKVALSLMWSEARQAVSGYCKYPMITSGKGKQRLDRKGTYKLSCRIRRDIRYPYKEELTIGSIQLPEIRSWKYITAWLTAHNDMELMVWIIGHELWHYLCKDKQRRGNYQTKANLYGLRMLKEYRRWIMVGRTPDQRHAELKEKWFKTIMEMDDTELSYVAGVSLAEISERGYLSREEFTEIASKVDIAINEDPRDN
jgi:hypothetical protein